MADGKWTIRSSEDAFANSMGRYQAMKEDDYWSVAMLQFGRVEANHVIQEPFR